MDTIDSGLQDNSSVEWDHNPRDAFDVPHEMLHDSISSSSQTSVSSLSTFVGIFPSKKQIFNYHRLGFHGRREESRKIMQALERTFFSSCSEFVLIRGHSGSGKSALIESLKEHMHKRGAYVVSGKFDQMRQDEPFSAIVAAFTDLVDILSNIHVASTTADDYNEQRQQAMNAIMETEDALMLRHLISNLYMREGDEPSPVSGLHASAKSALGRLTQCCCNFLRRVASPANPVVLHLDDIQWADESSLALLKALMCDPNSANILVICSSRDDEHVRSNPYVKKFLETDFQMKVTNIELKTLDLQSVNKMVSDLLDIRECMSLSLAEVVMKKTMGNPFFVLRYLESLEAQELLKRFSVSRWEWDLQRIQSETMVASNVADLVTDKIQRLHLDLQLVLKFAAFLGFEFNKTLLDSFVMTNEEFLSKSIDNVTNPDISATSIPQDATEACKNKISQLLGTGVEEGLLEKVSDGKYKFVHDRISQCLYDMIPEGEEKEKMHLNIGGLVWEMACSQEEPQSWMVFSAVNHLNQCRHSSLCGNVCQVKTARINLEAAKLSMKKAAFQPASTFCKTGLTLLKGPQKWENHYRTTLPLTRILAEIMFCKGEIPESKKLLEEILKNAKSLDDKSRAYYVMIDCLGTEGQLREAMDLGFSALREMGEKFPKKAGVSHVVWELVKTKRLLRGKKEEVILNLPMVTDERKLARLAVANLISTYAPFLGEEKQIVVLFLRITQMCVRDGISFLSPLAFSMYGMLEACTGNTQSAFRFGRLCMKLVDKIGDRQCGGLPHSICRAGLMHWGEPVRDSLEPLDRAMELSTTWGQSKDAFFCLQVFFSTALHCGESLDKLEERMRSCCEQKQQFEIVQENTTLLLMLVRPMWQGVLNLQGNAVDSAVVSGEALDKDTFVEKVMETGNWGAMTQLRLIQLEVAYLFGEYDLAAQTIKELGKEERMFSFHIHFYKYTLYSGLTYLALAERTGERQHTVKAKRFLKKLEKLNNVNSRPVLQLLRAAYFASKINNSELTQIRFDEAIATARRARLPNLEALANEVAWDASVKKQFAQKDYLARSIQLYSQWGAKAKVSSLEQYSHSLPATEGTTKPPRRAILQPKRNYFDAPAGEILGPVWAG